MSGVEVFKSWIPVLGFVLTGALFVYNYFSDQKLKNNHLFHLAQDVKSIKDKVDSIDKRTALHDTEIAVLQEKTKEL